MVDDRINKIHFGITMHMKCLYRFVKLYKKAHSDGLKNNIEKVTKRYLFTVNLTTKYPHNRNYANLIFSEMYLNACMPRSDFELHG